VFSGANVFRIFKTKIMVPQLGNIAVVWNTITIFGLKVFDICLGDDDAQWGHKYWQS